MRRFSSGSQRLETSLVLVHLGELALVAVQLDQLPLAGDLAGAVLGLLRGPQVALLALAGVARSSCRGTASTADRAAPRRGSPSRRGRRGRARPRAGCRGAGRECSSSHSSAPRSRWFVGSSRSSSSGSDSSSRASAARVCSPPERFVGGRSHSIALEAQAGERRLDPLVERVAVPRPRTRAGRLSYSGSVTRPSCSSRRSVRSSSSSRRRPARTASLRLGASMKRRHRRAPPEAASR